MTIFIKTALFLSSPAYVKLAGVILFGFGLKKKKPFGMDLPVELYLLCMDM